MVRLFIGVMIPEDLKNKLVLLQGKIKSFVDAKLVEKENLHISLSFLGEVGETEVGRICMSLDEICKNYERFEVKTGAVKFIPSLKFLRVVALGVENDLLKQMSSEIKTKIGGDVKPPHLTLCRAKKVVDVEGLTKVTAEELDFIVDRVSLMKSELSRSGPIYSVVHESFLR